MDPRRTTRARPPRRVRQRSSSHRWQIPTSPASGCKRKFRRRRRGRCRAVVSSAPMYQLDTTRIAIRGLLLLALASSAACLEAPPGTLGETTAELTADDPSARAQLALRWAPVHYQDVDQTGSHALGGAADYITNYDFDGNLNGRDNWDHAGNAAFPLRAHAYYSVVETSSHWFLVYLFFHPRDWTDSFFDTEHENDAEGVMLAVRRDGSTFGKLQAAVTVAHTDFFSYVPSGGTW